ncbi:hypothetical protein OPV22_016785 [Ensete ventricosum]|uniref:Uncharacterized protein n=1 Tax=Ensete ventricosum TaxID=4639 RepID=A0AAV8PEL3_ENSVE|nr:hypothetical protein OPV22_016785 [Ensete ventricosum]
MFLFKLTQQQLFPGLDWIKRSNFWKSDYLHCYGILGCLKHLVCDDAMRKLNELQQLSFFLSVEQDNMAERLVICNAVILEPLKHLVKARSP